MAVKEYDQKEFEEFFDTQICNLEIIIEDCDKAIKGEDDYLAKSATILKKMAVEELKSKFENANILTGMEGLIKIYGVTFRRHSARLLYEVRNV